MRDVLVAVLIFAGLTAVSLGAMLAHGKLPARQREDETHALVRHVSNLFVMMASLVLGLLVNSGKNAYEAIDHNLHSFATEMIQLDRMLRHYGSEADATRQRLRAYVERSLDHGWPKESTDNLADKVAEQLLNEVGNRLSAIEPEDAQDIAQLRDVRAKYRRVVELRCA